MQWIIGLSISLIGGCIVAGLSVCEFRKLIKYKKSKGEYFPAWLTGLVERLFFTLGIAFNLSGTIIAMIAWISAKMLADWNTKSNTDYPNIGAIRFTALLGGLISMLFALIGGLILNGELYRLIHSCPR